MPSLWPPVATEPRAPPLARCPGIPGGYLAPGWTGDSRIRLHWPCVFRHGSALTCFCLPIPYSPSSCPWRLRWWSPRHLPNTGS